MAAAPKWKIAIGADVSSFLYFLFDSSYLSFLYFSLILTHPLMCNISPRY